MPRVRGSLPKFGLREGDRGMSIFELAGQLFFASPVQVNRSNDHRTSFLLGINPSGEMWRVTVRQDTTTAMHLT
jgi:hypothetical protein